MALVYVRTARSMLPGFPRRTIFVPQNPPLLVDEIDLPNCFQGVILASDLIVSTTVDVV
jgi:hypothetical protein